VTKSRVPEARAGGVQSVDRAIAILELLSDQPTAGVTEIAQAIGVHKSTAFRLLASLEAGDLVEQTAHRGSYRLGFGLVRLATVVSDRLELTRQARPVCEALAAQVGETVNVAVLRGGEVVNLEQAQGPTTITTVSWVGRLTPPHATSAGKVLLAALAPEELEGFLAEELPRFTAGTVTELAALRRELARARELGYAVTVEELEPGLNAIAAPVRDRTGQVVAAISVSAPAFRLGPERIAEIAPAVAAAGADLSRRLGYGVRSAAPSSPS
jgi:DNA-binding IclR family transcriptional regulator